MGLFDHPLAQQTCQANGKLRSPNLVAIFQDATDRSLRSSDLIDIKGTLIRIFLVKYVAIPSYP